ncbi:unnamed protein product [Urochloa humidicola]
MEMAAQARRRRRRLEEEEDEGRIDRISGLPDGVLGDIVSLLPTKEGGRTQVLSSRWCHVWRAAPLNFDFLGRPVADVSRILSAHQGPGRRFSIRTYDLSRDSPAATLEGWLRLPALNNLQELEFHYGERFPRRWSALPPPPPPPPPASVHRFSSTLRVASFGGCGFPDGNSSALHFPLLKKLILLHVQISESSLHALLAGCPVLQSFLLSYSSGCRRIRIVSRTLRSIGLDPGWGDCRLQELTLEDARSLERLFYYPSGCQVDISVISAPKLDILGPLGDNYPKLDFGATVFQGSRLVSLITVVQSVKILALMNVHLSLDVVINFMKCFPCLEKLYIKTRYPGEKNAWCHKYRNLVGTLDIRLKKIVLLGYRGNKSHVNFAKFFVRNARVLESLVFEKQERISNEWIERQHNLLQTRNRASRGAKFDFVYHNSRPGPLGWVGNELAHDLSTADPFVRFRDWYLCS